MIIDTLGIFKKIIINNFPRTINYSHNHNGTQIANQYKNCIYYNWIVKSINEIMKQIITEEGMYHPHWHGMFTHKSKKSSSNIIKW